MKKHFFFAVVFLFTISSCKKTNDSSSTIDIDKLVGEEWNFGEGPYPFWKYKFNSDHTGYQKHIQNTITGTYFTNNITWEVTAGDTLRISFPSYPTYKQRKRIHAITDSTLLMNTFNLSTGAAEEELVEYYR